MRPIGTALLIHSEERKWREIVDCLEELGFRVEELYGLDEAWSILSQLANAPDPIDALSATRKPAFEFLIIDLMLHHSRNSGVYSADRDAAGVVLLERCRNELHLTQKIFIYGPQPPTFVFSRLLAAKGHFLNSFSNCRHQLELEVRSAKSPGSMWVRGELCD